MKKLILFLAVFLCLQINAKDFIINANANQSARIADEVTAGGGQVIAVYDSINVIIVSSDDPDFMATINSISGIESAAADIQVQFTSNPVALSGVTFDEVGDTHPGAGDDDVFFDLQWGHDAIDAPQAWDTGVTGAGSRVAVLDGGFDLDHPDLVSNINLGLSTSFVPGEELQYNRDDIFSHGTHVAGTIAAADNGIGTIGVAPDAELVLIKVLDDFGSGQFSYLIQGIMHAADADVNVINMSLGDYIALDADSLSLFASLQKAIFYAYRKGALLVAAAGNNATDLANDDNFKYIPAEMALVTSVSATTSLGWGLDQGSDLDLFAGIYSNFGKYAIDFSAPGGTFEGLFTEDLSIPCTALGMTVDCFLFDFIYSTGNGGWYWNVGTSMASPHVAGIAALIASKYNGNVSPWWIEYKIRKGAEDLGDRGRDAFYGKGRVNAYDSVTR